MEWYLLVLKKYADFNGRSRRKEYWMFALFNFLFAIAAVIIDNILGLAFENIGYGPITILYYIFTLVPGLAVAVRRLHDIGKSGFWFLLILIPVIGAIWLIVLFVMDSEAGDNKYGPNPKSLKPIEY